MAPTRYCCSKANKGRQKPPAPKHCDLSLTPRHQQSVPSPRDERDLAIAANNGWMVAYDNLSGLPVWLSDALCRLSTGGGFSTRTLYSNDEETIFDSKRPVILTGIDQIASRHDLLDRAVVTTLPVIPDDKRRSEAKFWAEFEEARPRILGALGCRERSPTESSHHQAGPTSSHGGLCTLGDRCRRSPPVGPR
jgi:hypothetical protein